MAVSPSKALPTRTVLLLEVHSRRHSRLRSIADRLGVTPQAVSVYLRRLTREGLVDVRDGTYRPTQRGTEALHRSMRDLRRFVDEAMGNLNLIEETIAQADGPIRAGDEVGLFMVQGRLRAATGVYAGSHGRARNAARPNDLVRVAELRGIVALTPAPITVVSHAAPPPAAQVRRARARLARAGPNGASPRYAAHDLTSAVLLERLGQRPDFEFAPLEAAIDAARRGVPVDYFVPDSASAECVAALARQSAAAGQPIPVRSVQL